MRVPSAGLFAATIATAVAMAACGQSTPAESDAGARTLTVWADADRATALLTFAEAYGRASDVQVEVLVVDHEELRTSFVSTHSGGLGPDLLVGPHDWTGELVREGAVAPVRLEPEQVDRFAPEAIEAVTYDGTLYGVPYATENLALIRNTDLAPRPPETLDDLIEHGRSLVDGGRADRVLSLQMGEEGDAYHVHPLFTSAGGYLFGEDGSGDPDPEDLGVASPESVAAMERLAGLGEQGAGVLSRAVTAGNAAQFFAEGRTPYLVTGPWNLALIRSSGLPYEVGPIPGFADGGPARPFIGVQSFFVTSGGDSQDLAHEFAANFADDPEFSLVLYDADPRSPALAQALEVVALDNPELAGFREAGENGLPMPAIPEMEAVWTPFGQAVADVVGGADPRTALEAAEAEIVAGLG